MNKILCYEINNRSRRIHAKKLERYNRSVDKMLAVYPEKCLHWSATSRPWAKKWKRFKARKLAWSLHRYFNPMPF